MTPKHRRNEVKLLEQNCEISIRTGTNGLGPQRADRTTVIIVEDVDVHWTVKKTVGFRSRDLKFQASRIAKDQTKVIIRAPRITTKLTYGKKNQVYRKEFDLELFTRHGSFTIRVAIDPHLRTKQPIYLIESTALVPRTDISLCSNTSETTVTAQVERSTVRYIEPPSLVDEWHRSCDSEEANSVSDRDEGGNDLVVDFSHSLFTNFDDLDYGVTDDPTALFSSYDTFVNDFDVFVLA
eukprot:TRINITY_DN293_c0_g1_i2.p1 TRINITY_DN293_c0_g1~~TRINITY_DN293_c0_g1_i2.p1  ORF type:complete len:238 (+),score=35.36 TRINITY_DN293_c0_g1_i2:93-806(+)